MTDILKASAGSGKTFNLARTYIGLLLASDDPYAYRHILAVTFTNKATAEMKSRILRELSVLATNPSASGYISDFKKVYGTPESISARASGILSSILHDYGAFSISTIDRFFQLALRSFARETGHFASYQVELDKDSLIQESVDRMLDSVEQGNPELREWLTDSAMRQLDEKGWLDLSFGAGKSAEGILSDALRELLEKNSLDADDLFRKGRLREVRKACEGVVKDYEEDLRAAMEDVLKVFSDIPEADFSKLDRSIKAPFGKVLCSRPDYLKYPSDTFFLKAKDPDAWFAKTNRKQKDLVGDLISGPIGRIVDIFEERYPDYRTAIMISGSLFSIGIATEVRREYENILREKNILGIDESNLTLRQIIDGSDAPFVYEKLGVRYDNFLLDEFQDTSVIQWENFRPLLLQSESVGGKNLVVGDIKQSIYRWRGSSWSLLANAVAGDIPGAVVKDPLRDNWRSLRNVVLFNNAFFRFASSEMDKVLPWGGGEVSSIYSDVEQNVRKAGGDGSVEVLFTENDQYAVILSAIRRFVDEGGSYGQVAVLVRKNSTGSDLALLLLENGIPVISDDSLKVKSSGVVRNLAALLAYAANPSDVIGSYVAGRLEITMPGGYVSLSDLCESLLASLREKDPAAFDAEAAYICAFMDDLQDWTSSWGNDLRGYLNHFESADPVISSPPVSDAVRIMTIHKAKGLEFPFVIVPFAEKEAFYKPDSAKWCVPKLAGTALEGTSEGVYEVTLPESASATAFGDDYREEVKLSHIDSLNTFYVALTRAEKRLMVIAAPTSESARKEGKIKQMGHMLEAFFRNAEGNDDMSGGLHFMRTEDEDGVIYAAGTPSPFDGGTPDPLPDMVPVAYGTSGSSLTGLRMGIRCDAAGFFTPDEGASARLKGILLHDIMSEIRRPEDLQAAVSARVATGDISSLQEEEYLSVLRNAVEEGKARGWVPEDGKGLFLERDIVSEGRILRPDRVVVRGGCVDIIDYKFGRMHSSYRAQVLSYMKAYRDMGYPSVKGYLWFPADGRVIEI